MYADSHSERRFFRRANIESLMENEDTFEPVFRYVNREQTARPKQGRRTQPRELGRDFRDTED